MTDLDLLFLSQIEQSPAAAVGESPCEKRLLVRPSEVARLLSISRTTLRRWDASGSIPRPVKVGRSAFWSVRTLESWECLGCPSRRAFEAMEAANLS